MTPNEYVKLAILTESNNFSSPTILGRLSLRLFRFANKNTLGERFTQKRNIRLIHAYVGISTEMEEVLSMLDKGGSIDRINLVEEIADCLWYCAIAADELQIDFDNLFSGLIFTPWNHNEETLRYQVEAQTRASIKVSGRLLDLVKKGPIYGKPLDIAGMTSLLQQLVGHLSENCHLAGFPIEEAMTRNIAKLKKRYAGKFTTHAAFNRDLKTERDILEGKKS